MLIRLRDFRDRLGLTLEDMAERSGFSVSMLSRWEKGASNIPSERLPQLASAYQCRVADIFDEDESPFEPLGPTLYVKGSVAGGVWREAWELDQDDWERFTGRADIQAPLRDRFGLRVVGDSMNEVYPPGTIVECIAHRMDQPIPSGKRVIIQRRRADDEIETTVKELLIDQDGHTWLVPRSNNPSFQHSIRLDMPEPGIVEVIILAVVVSSHRPE